MDGLPYVDPNAAARAAARSTACVPVLPPANSCPPSTDTRVRRYDTCGEEALPDLCAVDADSFQAPAPIPTPAPVIPASPGQQAVGNLDVVVSCYTGLTGAAVEIVPNTFVVLITALPANPTPAESSAYATALSAAQAQVAAQALAAGTASLNCYCVNVSQTETCPGSPANYPARGAISTFTVAAGAVRSYPDPTEMITDPSAAVAAAQATANAQAKATALASLSCMYGNQDQTEQCPYAAGGTSTWSTDAQGNPLNPISSPETLTTFEGVSVNIIGTGTVTANVFLVSLGVPPVDPSDPGYAATVTAAGAAITEANAEAQAAASSLLLCAWGNSLAASTQCASDAVNTAPVVVPVNTVVSFIRPTDANTQATNLATALLTCTWANDPQAYASICPISCMPGGNITGGQWPVYPTVAAMEAVPGINVNDVAGVFVALPSALMLPLRVNYYQWTGSAWVQIDEPYNCRAAIYQAQDTVVSIAAGTVVSYVSKADANAQAIALAQSQLICTYCNKAIVPYCSDAPNSSPMAPDNDAANMLLPVADSAYCGADFATAQSIASAIHSLPPSVVVTGTPVPCFWWSGPQSVTCAQPAAAYGPGAITSINLGARAVQSTISQADADAQAVAIATALLNCVFASAQITLRCAPQSDYQSILTGQVLFSTPYADNIEYGPAYPNINGALLDTIMPVAPGSAGSTASPVVIGRGAQTSFVSQAAANQLAFAQALAALNCYYVNAAVNLLCDTAANLASAFTTNANYNPLSSAPLNIGSGKFDTLSYVASAAVGAPGNAASVATGFFTNFVSQAGANAQAFAYTQSQLNCFYDSSPVTMRCDTAANITAQIAGQSATPAYVLNSAGNGLLPNTVTISIGSGKLDGEVFVFEPAVGSDSNPVSFPTGQFVSYISQLSANLLAISAAQAQLGCLYYNANISLWCAQNIVTAIQSLSTAELNSRCTNTTTADTLNVPDATSARGLLDGINQVDAACSGALASPVLVPSLSFSSTVSQASANQLALAAALYGLNCYYLNVGQTGTRGDCATICDGFPAHNIQPGTVPAGVVTSTISLVDANAKASMMAQSMSICICPDMVAGGEVSTQGTVTITCCIDGVMTPITFVTQNPT